MTVPGWRGKRALGAHKVRSVERNDLLQALLGTAVSRVIAKSNRAQRARPAADAGYGGPVILTSGHLPAGGDEHQLMKQVMGGHNEKAPASLPGLSRNRLSQDAWS
jgi:hypothetical protein